MKTFAGFVLPVCKTFCPTIMGFFVFCQVIGIMCPAPQMSAAGETVVIVEAMTLCPMDGSVTCAPGAISSPDRQGKPPLQIELDQCLYHGVPNSCGPMSSQGIISPSRALTYILTPLDLTPGVLRN